MQRKSHEVRSFIELLYKVQNYSIVINILMVNLVLFLAHAWYLQNYLSVEVTERLSFMAQDPTWMPPGQNSAPILGVHHFGDFQIIAGYSNSDDPYDPSLALPAQYLPFTFVLMKFLMLFGLNNAFYLYALLTFLAIVIPVVLFTKNTPIPFRFIYVALILLLTQPFLTIFDRGNLQGLMSGLIFLSLYFYMEKKRKLAFFFLILASSFKGYPILLLLFVKRERIKSFILGVVTLSGFTFINFLLLDLDIFKAVLGYRSGLSVNQSSCLTCGYSASSLLDKFVLTIFPGFTREGLVIINIGLSLLLLGVGIFIASRDYDQLPIKTIFVSMSFLQVFPSLANNFTLIWASIPLILMCKQTLDFKYRQGFDPKRILILLSCLVSIMPNLVLVLGPGGHVTWLMSLLSPSFILLTYLFLIRDSFTKSTNTSTTKQSALPF
jgi:hypothetical protein